MSGVRNNPLIGQLARVLAVSLLLGAVPALALASDATTTADAAAKSEASTQPADTGPVSADGQTRFGPAPETPTGPLEPAVAAALEVALGDALSSRGWGRDQIDALRVIAGSGDPRLAWLVSDLLRIVRDPGFTALLAAAGTELTGTQIHPQVAWGMLTDHLIAWNIPAPPGYLKYKRNIYTLVVPTWSKIFVPGNIDWRHVSWGGVGIDDRPYDGTDVPCNCIPAADNPPVVTAAESDWLKDDDVVFGVSINGEHRAYPRQIMEVREMVNDTLGGRTIGMPYCTLCGSAQAYFTDRMPDGLARPVLRTSGLLIRSNKVMFDVVSWSVFDTFKGRAVTGLLAERGVTLPQAGVVTTTWGEWKAAHPDTTVLEQGLGFGQNFDFRNGRDANGPIFPIGDVDQRLPVQEDVVGAITASGKPVAFRVSAALTALEKGEAVGFENVKLVLDGGGVRAVGAEGEDIGAHQAFWFAWSQFYPGTELWPAP